MSLVIGLVLTGVNVALTVFCWWLDRRIKKAREAAVEYKRLADDAFESARLIFEFQCAYRKCRSDDEIADLLIEWVPRLRAHGIDIRQKCGDGDGKG